jgi:hypothetical protein
VTVEPPSRLFVEGRGPDSGLAWAAIVPSLSLTADLPADAVLVRVSRGSATKAFALFDVSDPSPRPPDEHRSIPAPGKRWTLAVVSERFEDAETFFAHAAALQAFIAGQAPFSGPGISFGVEALFWASDATTGLFGASDSRLSDGRVLQGEGKRVRRFVRESQVDPQKILVAVNSRIRAGAGGQGREVPSWTTVTGAAHEPWEAIALHELGHAFGLADEYDTAYDLEEPTPLEPNVSKESDPARTSWHLLANASAPPAPTALRGQEHGHPPNTVGTFQGARYRSEDRFRPSPNCRMRVTTVAFCEVCQRHIRNELLA